MLTLTCTFLSNVDLYVEITIVYLVFYAPSRTASQDLNPSAEFSFIYLRCNDGLQKYSFRFHSSCFDFWPLAGFPLKHCTEFISETLQPLYPHLMKAQQIWDRAGSKIFSPSVAVLTTVKCDLFKTRYMFLRGERDELRTVVKGNVSDMCQPPTLPWCVLPLAPKLHWLFPTLNFSGKKIPSVLNSCTTGTYSSQAYLRW